MRPAPELGDTLLVDGRPAVVVSLLPGKHRQEGTARYAYDLPCGGWLLRGVASSGILRQDHRPLGRCSAWCCPWFSRSTWCWASSCRRV